MGQKLNTIHQDMITKNISQKDLNSKSSLAFKNSKKSMPPMRSPRKINEEDEFDSLNDWLPDIGPINHI
jgi:hypothetical protein